MNVTIYHNPDCDMSSQVLDTIRSCGEDPRIVFYLEDPPSRGTLIELIEAMKMKPRDLLRQKALPYDRLGLDDESLSDGELLDAMMSHPVLIDRPIVVSDKGVRLCQPPEEVLTLLDDPAETTSGEDDEATTSAE